MKERKPGGRAVRLPGDGTGLRGVLCSNWVSLGLPYLVVFLVIYDYSLGYDSFDFLACGMKINLTIYLFFYNRDSWMSAQESLG